MLDSSPTCKPNLLIKLPVRKRKITSTILYETQTGFPSKKKKEKKNRRAERHRERPTQVQRLKKDDEPLYWNVPARNNPGLRLLVNSVTPD
jgi:hypothetical protein